MPVTLKALMWHPSIETTMKYYVDQNADDVSREVRRAIGTHSGIRAENRHLIPESEAGDEWQKCPEKLR